MADVPDTSDVSRILERKFELAHQQIILLKGKIHVKDGPFWPIVWHRYSVEELLDSEHHLKIYTITGKIGDDVANWHENDRLGSADYAAYHEQRHQVELRLEEVNQEIKTRQPTLWERLSTALIKFITMVMDRMPMVRKIFKLPVVAWVIRKLPAPIKDRLRRLPLPDSWRERLGLGVAERKRLPATETGVLCDADAAPQRSTAVQRKASFTYDEFI